MSIDLNGALSSPSLGFKYYINYYYQGNSLNITPAEIGEIKATYVDKLETWKNYVENIEDVNVYEIDEDDYDAAMASGEQYGKDLTGYQNSSSDKWDQGLRTGVDGAITGFSAARGLYAGYKIAGAGAVKAGVQSGGKLLGKVCSFVACALDFADAILYWISRPNKEQHEAVMKVNEDMNNQLSMSTDAQNYIIDMDGELMNLNDEANDVVDEANQQMGENKVQYDFNRDTIEYFEADRTSGYQFTAEDVAAYQEALAFMQKTGENITTTKDESGDRVNEIHEEMAGYEAGFDEAEETIGEVNGFTDYAAGFDEMTKKACTAEYWNKTIAAATSAMDAMITMSQSNTVATFWMYAFALLAVAAGVQDGLQAAEQKKWANEIEQEIDSRENTQEVNAESYNTLDEYTDYYGGYMTDVESLELAVPEDVEPPTETAPPAGNNGGDNNGEDGGNRNGNGKKPPKKP